MAPGHIIYPWVAIAYMRGLARILTRVYQSQRKDFFGPLRRTVEGFVCWQYFYVILWLKHISCLNRKTFFFQPMYGKKIHDINRKQDHTGEENMNEPVCYCGSQKNYKDCCYPFLTRASKPETPEQLMRSRYTSFCIKDIEYLISTHHPSRQQANEREQLTKTIHDTQWLGLKILKTEMDPDDPDIGFVEFAAFYKTNEMGQLHERSKFIHEAGNWYYLDGEFMEALVFGRNDPCWCGSNKKYKKCHGR